MTRNSIRYVSLKNCKPLVATLPPTYATANVQAAQGALEALEISEAKSHVMVAEMSRVRRNEGMSVHAFTKEKSTSIYN